VSITSVTTELLDEWARFADTNIRLREGNEILLGEVVQSVLCPACYRFASVSREEKERYKHSSCLRVVDGLARERDSAIYTSRCNLSTKVCDIEDSIHR
jgi:hypothetical protein